MTRVEQANNRSAADDPAAVLQTFRRAGMRVQEHDLASAAGPRWGLLVHSRGADLWVEASDRIEAWWKAAAYAVQTGMLRVSAERGSSARCP